MAKSFFISPAQAAPCQLLSVRRCYLSAPLFITPLDPLLNPKQKFTNK
ncbi:hypothetical protein COLO4_15865 [Corchorus olitorius]|uniref:Uncharacterized protein n=1 Tax=Corchorus olitorius TaxID=93759 RepID=A0A1R3JKT1_9ROSI|nr:hypothetical protein COLO4_15865 [Corchorus olitorius]